MKMSAGLSKLEANKGFRCNQECDTCVCEMAHKSIVSQINIYDELYGQGVITIKKHSKVIDELKSELNIIYDSCNRLCRDYWDMIYLKVEQYYDLCVDSIMLDKMSAEDYRIFYEEIVEKFFSKYVGRSRYVAKSNRVQNASE